jgi:hypothetical protein
MNKQHLKEVALNWAYETISDWFYERGAWDHLYDSEDAEITLDELDWIQENIKFKIEIAEDN